MDETIVRHLRTVGLSLYEARVYVALLRHGAQNGNELSRNSNVPSSKVYSTLEKLTLEGFAQTFRRGTQTLFVALPASELVSRLRRVYAEPLDYLEETLPRITAKGPTEPVLTVSGLRAILAAARTIIDTARVEAHISCWASDLPEVRGSLDAAAARGVAVFGMLYGRSDDGVPGGSWLHHHYEDIVEGRVDGRMMTLVVDDAEALIARIPHDGAATAVRTRSAVVTLIVQEYLHHDIVLQRAQINIGFDEWDRWWQADPDLRIEILGRLAPPEHSVGLDGPTP